MSLTFGHVLLEAATPGGYVSIYKAVAVLLLLLIWTRLLHLDRQGRRRRPPPA